MPETTCVFCGQCVGVCPTCALKRKREWLLEQSLGPSEVLDQTRGERRKSGEQIIIANSDLLGSRVRNYGRMNERRVVFGTRLTYETPLEQLEEIPGLGPAKRRELLKSFGGLQGVRQASVEDLAKVRGISRPLAALIFEKMNPGP